MELQGLVPDKARLQLRITQLISISKSAARATSPRCLRFRSLKPHQDGIQLHLAAGAVSPRAQVTIAVPQGGGARAPQKSPSETSTKPKAQSRGWRNKVLLLKSIQDIRAQPYWMSS
ncbi:hypothetical protein SELMODRAFT_428280 [Selaginella moellendorffii]|uniref:Uncharacterized protein n=1 Tax=Selaginella moellendorffii TaxID=88036 RepID=D8T2B8_SELML|nr:hypothetical protein SELMODRAFT_428280 [Selaginella moellendorffii]